MKKTTNFCRQKLAAFFAMQASARRFIAWFWYNSNMSHCREKLLS